MKAMATKRAAAKTVDPDIEKAIEKSLEPTETFTEYGEWLAENVPGVEFDLQQVILAMRLYGKFQDYNRENGGSRTREAKQPGTKPASAKPATKATAAKPAAKPRGKAAPADDDAKPAAAKPAAAKPKSGRRGKVATDTEDAPF